MPFSHAAHVARSGSAHNNSGDDNDESDETYTSPTEHNLTKCYKYKTMQEQKHCVKDLYDDRYSSGTVFGLGLVIILLVLALISVIVDKS